MYRRSQTSGSVDARLNISDDGLGRSWDTASRFRLQEAGLAIGAAHRDALFRVQVELGLHELTAALSSLSRRLELLEASVTPNGGRLKGSESDEAAKGLARSARCVSQALPGIVSARARRKALHAYFRESDEQNETVVLDAATRALVVEGLAHLAGKYRDQAQSDRTLTTSPSTYRGRDHQSVRADEGAESLSEFLPPSPVSVITRRHRFIGRQVGPAQEESAPPCVDSIDVQVDHQSPSRMLRAGRSQDKDGAELEDFIPNSRLPHDPTRTVSPPASVNRDNTDNNDNGLRETNRPDKESGLQPSAGADERQRPGNPLRASEVSNSTSGAHFSRGAGTSHSYELERVEVSTSDEDAEFVARVSFDAAVIAAEAEEKRGGPKLADGEGLAARGNGYRGERGGAGDSALDRDTEAVHARFQVPRPYVSSSSAVLCSSSPSNDDELKRQMPPRTSPPFRQTSTSVRDDDHNGANSDNIRNTGEDYNSQLSYLKPVPQGNYTSATAPTASAINFGSSGVGVVAAKDCKTTAALSRSMDNAHTSTSVGVKHGEGVCPGQEVIRDRLDRAWGRVIDDRKLAIDVQGFLNLGALEEEGTLSSTEGHVAEGSAKQNSRLTARTQALRKLEQRLKEEEEAAASREAVTELRRELLGATSKYSGFPDPENSPLPPMRSSSSSQNPSLARLSAVLSDGAAFSRGLPADDKTFLRSGLNPDSHPGIEPSLGRLPLFDSELRAGFVAALTTHIAQVGAADAGKAGVSATPKSTRGDRAIEGAESSESKKLALPRTPPNPTQNSVRDGSTAEGGLSVAESTDVAKNLTTAVAENDGAPIFPRGQSIAPSDDDLIGPQGREAVALGGKAGCCARSVVDSGPARVVSDEVGGPSDSVEETKQDLGTQREDDGDDGGGLFEKQGGGALAEVTMGSSTEKKGGADGDRSSGERVAADNNNWAQEYHDYLCNKEKEREAAAANARQSSMAADS